MNTPAVSILRPDDPPFNKLEACFFVSDSTGQKLAYVYFEEARAAISGQAAHPRRGAAHRRTSPSCRC